MPMVVDSMDNLFDKNFGAWPFRFFIVHNNHLVYKVPTRLTLTLSPPHMLSHALTHTLLTYTATTS